ncbi:MAG: hypothetical protein LBI72_05700 [Flavobacteriaceae bacterium]|jgi:hypothetical protein|nr:hypothetical protein [Flavobacteriaceae bacterium]
MKKITLLAALLGTTYFANAQVGIGTADPATSAELEIVAKAGDKGIIIPRVALNKENEFAPIKGAQVESLLVYNNAQSAAMPKGFYYWDGAKWNRIIGKTELDTVVENLGNDITNIQNVINYILPSNPDNTDTTKPGHTTIVYDNTTGDMYEVVYDATTKKYITKKIDLLKMIQGKETNTFFREIKDGNGKITGYVYFNEKTIVDAIGTETDAAKIKIILDGLDATTPGAISIDVKGTVVNNFKEILEAPTTIIVNTKEGDKTFTTVEQYLQYISQSADGNVIYKNISTDPAKPNWVFQYYDKAKGEYVTISLRDLVAGTETKTFVKEIKENGKVTGFVYFSEQTIIDWLAADKANTVDNILNNAKGAVTVDVKGTVVNNIQEILKSTTEIKEGNKTFTTVEQYLQYISQLAEGNVIYKEIDDVNNPGKKVWVFQYYDKVKGEYVTIKLDELVAGFETKTNILRTESKANGKLEAYAEATAPVEATVKKGEIFYKYNNEDKGEQFINMTADIISSINNNEDVKNALTNILNQGGNVYFGKIKDTDKDEVFYTMVVNADGTTTKTPIVLPASFILDIINKYKDVVKNALGDHINNTTTIVNTGNTYNGKMVFLAKGTTTVGKVEGAEQYPSPLTTGTTIDLSKIAGLTTIEDVLTISILKAGKVVASSVTDLVITGNKLVFAIGTGSFYTSLPYGEYEVVVEFTGNLAPMAPIVPQP